MPGDTPLLSLRRLGSQLNTQHITRMHGQLHAIPIIRRQAHCDCMEVGYKLCILGLKHCLATPLSFNCQFIAAQQSVRLHKVSITAGALRSESLLIGNCGF